MIKIFRFYVTSVMLIIITISCSSDDPATEENPFLGSWNLVEINMEEEVDLNDDGNLSINLLDEISCLHATLTIQSDTFWISTGTSFNLNEDGSIANTCTAESESNGKWQVSNDGAIIIAGVAYNLIDNKLINERENDILEIQSVIYQADK